MRLQIDLVLVAGPKDFLTQRGQLPNVAGLPARRPPGARDGGALLRHGDALGGAAAPGGGGEAGGGAAAVGSSPSRGSERRGKSRGFPLCRPLFRVW